MSPCDTSVEVYMNGVCHGWGDTYDWPYLASFNMSNEALLTTSLPQDLYDSFEW